MTFLAFIYRDVAFEKAMQILDYRFRLRRVSVRDRVAPDDERTSL